MQTTNTTNEQACGTHRNVEAVDDIVSYFVWSSNNDLVHWFVCKNGEDSFVERHDRVIAAFVVVHSLNSQLLETKTMFT